MIVVAIDPGTTESAYVRYDASTSMLRAFGKLDNQTLRQWLSDRRLDGDCLAIEMIASYGMPVGAEVFETCVWIGHFEYAWGIGRPVQRVYRREVKLALCGSPRAKDGNVRQAILDRYGGKSLAIGTKKAPGPLYGVSADIWQALGVAITWSDARRDREGNMRAT